MKEAVLCVTDLVLMSKNLGTCQCKQLSSHEHQLCENRCESEKRCVKLDVK